MPAVTRASRIVHWNFTDKDRRTMEDIIKEGNTLAARQSLRYRDDVAQTVKKISLAATKGSDWDDAPGETISSETANRAATLVEETAVQAYSHVLAWRKPAVSATADGGIHLSWRIDRRWATVTIFAAGRDAVCVTKDTNGTSKRELISDSDWEPLINRILAVFQKQQPSKVAVE